MTRRRHETPRPLEGKRRREGGAAMLLVLLAMIPLIGLLALAMQVAQLTATRAALQDYVDARAVAAIQDRFGGYTERVDVDVFIPGQIDPGTDPVCGGWDHSARNFASASPCRSASGVPAHRVEHAISVPVLFAPLATLVGGDPTADLSAYATSFIPERHVMLVQDVSTSLGSIDASQDALRALVDTMNSHDLPGDQVGLLAFGSDVEVKIGLTDLESDLGAVHTAIDDLALAGATCTSGGIKTGREQLQPIPPEHEVAPLMIVVTDGSPNTTCAGTSGDPTDSAVSETETACSSGIDVWAIAVGSPDMTALGQLACDSTQVIPVSDPAGVSAAVVNILTGIPVRLVE